jgi:cytochrome P450
MEIRNRVPDGPKDAYDTQQDLLDWLRERFHIFGDIYSASVYGANVYVVSAPAYVEHVLLKNWQNYVKGRAIKRIALLLGKGLMVSEGEFWISQRRMVQPAFHRNVIGALTDVISAANQELLVGWEDAARRKMPVNVTRDLSQMVLQVVLRAIFGDDYAEVAPNFNILTEQPERSLEFAEAFRPLAQIVIQLAVQRRSANRPASDILGLLMQARDRDSGQQMSDRQLTREVMTLIVAGHETTASVLNWTWYLLSQHPAADEKMSRELDELSKDGPPALNDLQYFSYTRQVLDEAMRLYPPGWLMTRKALRDDRLGEYFVPAGTEIYISPYLIHRHPDLWDEPERFYPERFGPDQSKHRHPLTMLPFSMGPRNCIGEFLARIEMQIHLITIAGRLRMRYVAKEPPQAICGVNLLTRTDLMMTPELRVSQSAVDASGEAGYQIS